MYHTIVVPLDGSKRAESILPHVENLAGEFGSKVIFVQVLEPLPSVVGAQGTHLALSEQAMHQQEHEAEGYLAGVRGAFAERGITAETRVVYGPIVATILKIAEHENADLIAIASQGASGVAGVFYGSAAAGILHRIDRPLLIVRAC